MLSGRIPLRLILITITVLLMSHASSFGQQEKSIRIKDLKWLTGTWDRTNNKPGRSGHERWLLTSSDQMNGFGVTMKGSDTLFIEKLKIIDTDSGIYYIADVPENKRPVSFKLTSATFTELNFENPQHDFPKRIEYIREGEKLHVTVSGDRKSIDYFFSKR